jgi:uncharacterized membrane protein YgaE (UPF0421/DUF939 family)
MNKKAQVATIMLFLVAIGLSLTAWFTMVSFDNTLQEVSKNFSELTSDITFKENYIKEQSKLIGKETLSSCTQCSPEQFKQKLIEISTEKENLFRYEGAGNFYAKIRNEEFEITKQDTSFSLKIKDLFVESQQGSHKVKRNFRLELLIG